MTRGEKREAEQRDESMSKATERAAAASAVESAPVRTRTIEWRDPLAAAAEGRALGGIAYLEAVMAGRVAPPPIAETLGFRLVEVGEGRAVFACTPAEYHYNPLGTVHGGLAATLIDSATGCAIQSVCLAGHGWTTLELKVSFVRAMTKDTGEMRCEGRIIHSGARVARAEARLVDRTGRLYAYGAATCLFFPLDKG